MANTTLRAYLEDLNALLERESFEEVIGHCRHILQHFPKNVETYRVLGRALLERGRHQEASDVFQRVLSAIPDDFTAHLGLNSAYEESDIPASVWHLERAYEQQPNNEVIRTELQRLYALRDGKSPEHLQLTRGALARFYLNGRLYDQATAELQSALEQSPERVDLLLLLARTLWESEHPIESSEVALRILETLPYCIEANHVLAALWINSGRPAEAEPYVTLLEQLDPFLAWETVNRGQRLVPEDAFQLPRLHWDVRTAAALATDVPDWVATIGDVFETPEAGDPQFGEREPVTAGEPRQGTVPTWLQDVDEGSGGARPSDAFEMPNWGESVAPAAGAPSSGVPDWLTDAPPEQTPVEAALDPMAWLSSGPETPSEEQTPQADEFDWMADAAPKTAAPEWLFDTSEESQPATEPQAEAELDMDWLLGRSAASAEPEPSAPLAEPADDLGLDWLSTAPAEPEQSAPVVEAADGLGLDWLSATPAEPEPSTPVVEAADGLGLDWLSATPAEPEPSAPVVEAADELGLDWLSAAPAEPEQSAPVVEAADELGLDWLSAAPAEPEQSAPVVEAADELGLDWLSAAPAEPEPSAPVVEAADELGLDWLSATPAEPEPSAEPADEINLDWLGAAPAKPESSAPVAEPADEMNLDWLLGGAGAPAEPEPSAPVPEPADEINLDWLGAAPAEPEPAASVAEPADEIDLDWLGAAPVEPKAVIASESVPEAAPEDDPMAWMKQFGLAPAADDAQPVESVPGELDAHDLAEFEALKQLVPSDEQPPVEASQMSSEDVLAWLQEPSQPEATPADTLNWGQLGQTDGFGSFAQPGTAPTDWPAQASSEPALEDEWLAAFESETEPPLETLKTPAGEPAVSEATQETAPVEEERPAADVPLWKRQIVTASLAQKHETHEPEESPTWLDETGPEAPVNDTPAWMREDAVADNGDWMSPEAQAQFDDLIQQTSEKASQPRMVSNTGVLDPKNTPDWLQAFEEEPAPAPAESVDQAQSSEPEVPDAAAIPDWLHEFAPQDSTPAQPEAAMPLESLDFSSLEVGTNTPVAQPADLVNTTDTQAAPPTFTFDREPAWKRRKKAQTGDAPQ